MHLEHQVDDAGALLTCYLCTLSSWCQVPMLQREVNRIVIAHRSGLRTLLTQQLARYSLMITELERKSSH